MKLYGTQSVNKVLIAKAIRVTIQEWLSVHERFTKVKRIITEPWRVKIGHSWFEYSVIIEIHPWFLTNAGRYGV